jgi:hypothetical protein
MAHPHDRRAFLRAAAAASAAWAKADLMQVEAALAISALAFRAAEHIAAFARRGEI